MLDMGKEVYRFKSKDLSSLVHQFTSWITDFADFKKRISQMESRMGF